MPVCINYFMYQCTLKRFLKENEFLKTKCSTFTQILVTGMHHFKWVDKVDEVKS